MMSSDNLMSVVAESWFGKPEIAQTEARNGDGVRTREQEFAALAERHGRLLFRVAYGLLRNTEDSEDAVQEAMLKLYRGDAWRAMENERAFLARTVWRVGLDRLARRPARMEDVTEMELAAEGGTPEENAVDGAERALLHRLIDALPEQMRQILILSAIEGLTSREVAAALGIPEGTARTRLMRARLELKRRFEAGKEGRR